MVRRSFLALMVVAVGMGLGLWLQGNLNAQAVKTSPKMRPPQMTPMVPEREMRGEKGNVPLARLEAELRRLSNLQWGRMGLAIEHLESGQRVEIEGDERFPMASAVKVAIALELMKRVEEGKESLDRMVPVKVSDIHPGSGMLGEYFPKGGLALTMRNLMELMMLESDNSATDIVLREVGGAAPVKARLKGWGIEGIDVSRSIVDLLADLAGVKGYAEGEAFTMDGYQQAAGRLTADQRVAAGRAFYADTRDTSTPAAMALTLKKLYQGQLLNADGTRVLVDVMERCRTGASRIKGILPKDTNVAHKTGTFSAVAVDVGVMTLPGKAGHLVIAAFVKGAAGPEKDRAIAEVSRAAHDFFVFYGE